jgi:polyisoprenoid-binding protein YceI
MRLLSARSLRRVLTLAALVALPAFASAESFKIDPVHTTVIYRIKHLASSYSYGRFDNVTGTFEVDAAALEKSTFDVNIPVADIDSGNDARNKHLKSPDFFDEKQFPTITFKSTSVKKTGDNTIDVTGDLTVHGVTKSVTIPFTFIGEGSNPQAGTRAGFEGELKLNRSDYGMNGWQKVVGDDVTLIVSVEGVKQ